ncbi:hypothetical protein BGZ63DRAFT_240729 [Mariannaea sp. PMI_226]|nr:hypothetical protein BGZ63DRAFT_240729 [Mariannaea sp. PMI_226]
MADTEIYSTSRRILAVGLEGETAVLSQVLKDLTGTAPTTPSAELSLAGTTHPLTLTTPYYSATVPIWLDLITNPPEWSASFLSPEAVEVLAVLGGVVVVFTAGPASGPAAESTRSLISHVGKVVKQGLGGWDWDGVVLAVGVGDGDEDEWDEICAEAGLEFVLLRSKETSGRNEFGEKTGIARVREALEANDWTQLEAPFSESDFGDFESSSAKGENDDKEDLNPEKMGFGFDRSDFEGLRHAIWEAGQLQHDDGDDDDDNDGDAKKSKDDKDNDNEGSKGKGVFPLSDDKISADAGFGDLDDEEIAKVERMMRKLQAVREAGEGMGEEQRKRMAARAVEEVMREL